MEKCEVHRIKLLFLQLQNAVLPFWYYWKLHMSKIIHVHPTSLQQIPHEPPFNFPHYYMKERKLKSGISVFYIHIYFKNSFFLFASSSSHLFETFLNPKLVVNVLAWNIFSCVFYFYYRRIFHIFCLLMLTIQKVFELQYWTLITAIAPKKSRMHIYLYTYMCCI